MSGFAGMKIPLFMAAIIVAVIVLLIPIVSGGSETDLVNMSYLAVPLFAFGIFGGMAKKKAGKNPVVAGAVAAVIALVLLWIFYVQIWPML